MDNHADQRMDGIRNLLKENPRGLSISEVADRLGLKRNLVSADLSYMERLGQVEMQSIGTSKVYFATAKVPLSGILNHSSEMVLILDESRRVVDANDPFLKMAGAGKDETIGLPLEQCPGSFFAAVRAIDEQGMEAAQELTLWLPQLDDPRGIRHFRGKRIPTIFENNRRGTMILIEDVTKEIRYRDALRQSEMQYRAIVQDLSDLIFRFLPNGTLTYGNRICAVTFGRMEADLPGQNIYSFLSDREKVELIEQVHAVRAGEPAHTKIHTFGTPQGQRKISLTIRGIFGENGKIVEYQGIGRDITSEIAGRDAMLQYIAEKEFICRKSQDFLETTTTGEIFAHLGAGIHDLVPDAVIMIFLFDQEAESMKTVMIRDENGADLVTRIFGDQGFVFPMIREGMAEIHDIQRLTSGRLVEFGTEGLNHLIGEQNVGRLRSVIGQRTVYGTMLASETRVLGAVSICLPQGKDLPNPELLETCICLASLTLQKHLMKESLTLSISRFSTLTEKFPLPIAIIGQDGRYLFLNDRFIETFGYTLDDIPDGRRWFLHAFPDADEMKVARNLWLQDLKNSKSGEIRSRSFRVRCRDGSFRLVLFHPVTLLDRSQLVMYEDISGQEEAEKTRNLLAEIIRSSHDAIIGMTITGRIQTWNPGAERIYGFTAEEVTGRDIGILFPPSRIGEKDEILARVGSGESLSDLETQRVRKDGTLIDVSVTVSPVVSNEGVITGTSTIVRDITLKKTEERMRALESKYQSLVDSINVGVYRSTGDPRGRFIWGNSTLVKILGYPSFDAVTELPVADIFLETDGRKHLIEELKQNGFVKNRDLMLKKGDGSVVYARVTALATFGPEGEVSFINGIVEDVTENRILARKLAFLQDSGEAPAPSP